MSFQSCFLEINGQTFDKKATTQPTTTLHIKTMGDPRSPMMLMLHGFPEYWVAWSAIAERLKEQFFLVLPDQRGFNKSSAPQQESAYHTKHLVADMLALMEHFSPDRPVILCGHDWGASVAYALAMRYHRRISHLIIANGVHPVCFQKALLETKAQMEASQYFHVLKAKGSESHLAANGYEKLLKMFEKFSTAPWLDEPMKQDYRTAWSHPGVLCAMLNWYRQSPITVPLSGAGQTPMPITQDMMEKYKIPMPHLLLWGMADTALLPQARENLEYFSPNLVVREKQNASHWILHEHPQWVADEIMRFLL